MDELSVLIADAKAILEQIEQIEAGESGVEPMAEITEPGGEMGPVDGENADIFTEEETKEEEIAKSKRMAKKSFMNETQGDEQSEGTTASDDSDEYSSMISNSTRKKSPSRNDFSRKGSSRSKLR
jgi:hypothetical protein